MKLILRLLVGVSLIVNSHCDISMAQKMEGMNMKYLTDTITNYAKKLQKNLGSIDERKSLLARDDFQPEQTKANALQKDREMRKVGEAVRYADESFRYCIFPSSLVNTMTLCNQLYAPHKVNESLRCKQVMCINCCNLQEQNLLHISQTYIMGTIFEINQLAQWKQKAEHRYTRRFIDKCRHECQQIYPVEAPEPDFIAPNDLELGMTRNNPAKDCRDVAENGPGKTSGKYFIQPSPTSDALEMYCDMDVGEGGWTLMAQYSIKNGKDLEQNTDKVPLEFFESNSNLVLKEKYFTSKQAGEFRLFCYQNNQEQKVQFMHFSVKSKHLTELLHSKKEVEYPKGGDQAVKIIENYEWPKDFEKNMGSDQELKQIQLEQKQITVTTFNPAKILEKEIKVEDFYKQDFLVDLNDKDHEWGLNFGNGQFRCGQKVAPGKKQVSSMFAIYFKPLAKISQEELNNRWKAKEEAKNQQ